MSVVEKRSLSRPVDPAAEDGRMSAMTDNCVALVVALILYRAWGRALPARRRGGRPAARRLSRNLFPGSFLHNTLSEVNFPAPGGCTQLGQAGAVL